MAALFPVLLFLARSVRCFVSSRLHWRRLRCLTSTGSMGERWWSLQAGVCPSSTKTATSPHTCTPESTAPSSTSATCCRWDEFKLAKADIYRTLLNTGKQIHILKLADHIRRGIVIEKCNALSVNGLIRFVLIPGKMHKIKLPLVILFYAFLLSDQSPWQRPGDLHGVVSGCRYCRTEGQPGETRGLFPVVPAVTDFCVHLLEARCKHIIYILSPFKSMWWTEQPIILSCVAPLSSPVFTSF